MNKQLHEKRGSLIRQADVIITTAGREKRAISNSEDIILERIKGEIFDVDAALAKASMEIRSLPIENGSSTGGMDLTGFSVVRAIRSASTGRLDGLEGEASAEISRRTGVAPQGFFIPAMCLVEKRGGMTISQDGGIYGNKAVATMVADTFIEALRASLICGRAGATLLGGLHSNLSLPRHKAASNATWKPEIGALDESTQEIEEVRLTARRVGAWSKYSKQLLVQASPGIEEFVKNDLIQAIASAIDIAALTGTGLNDQPTGILNTAGIGSVIGGTNGAAPTFAHLVSLMASVANSNALAGNPAFVFSSKVEAKLRGTQKIVSTDSTCLLDEGQTTISGQPWLMSNNSPDNLTKGTASGCSSIIFGNWSDLIIASFGDSLDLISDPFSLATTGQTRVIVAALADIGVRHSGSFSAFKDCLTA